jgi:vacuolar-type H+-ATPase subunit I/STV1
MLLCAHNLLVFLLDNCNCFIMGSWWRSEEMTYVSVIVSEDAAHTCIKELGQLGCCQFTDLNPDLTPFQRRYVSYIKRCDEIERKIRYCHGEVIRLNVPVQSAGAIDNFLDNSASTEEGTHAGSLLENLEAKLDKYEKQLLELNKFNVKLAEEYNSKVYTHKKKCFLLQPSCSSAHSQSLSVSVSVHGCVSVSVSVHGCVLL